MVWVVTRVTGVENVIRGRTLRVTERVPFRGDAAVTLGTIRSGVGTGWTTDSGGGLVEGVAFGSGVGVGLADGVGDEAGVGDGVPAGSPATRSSAALTWRSPYPDSGLCPPAPSGRAVWVRLAHVSSGVSEGRIERRRAIAPVTWGVAMLVPEP
jgi:hypothetical protein